MSRGAAAQQRVVLLGRAVRAIAYRDYVTQAWLAGRLEISVRWAAQVLADLEAQGVVGAQEAKGRRVLFARPDLDDVLGGLS